MIGSPLYLARGYFSRRRTLFVALTLVFAGGLVLGAIASGRTDPALQPDLTNRVEDGWRSGAGDFLGPTGPTAADAVQAVRAAWLDPGGIAYFIGAQAIFALSFVGAPLALVLLFWRGFALGFTAAWTVQLYSWPGVALALALLGPGHALRVPALLLATAATLDVCWEGLRLLWGSRTSLRRPALRALLLWGAGAALLTVGAVLESLFSPGLAAWTAGWLLKE